MSSCSSDAPKTTFAFSQETPPKFVIAVLMEYIRSLNQFQVPVQVPLAAWGLGQRSRDL